MYLYPTHYLIQHCHPLVMQEFSQSIVKLHRLRCLFFWKERPQPSASWWIFTEIAYQIHVRMGIRVVKSSKAIKRSYSRDENILEVEELSLKIDGYGT